MHIVRSLGRVAAATDLGHVGFTAIVGFGICLALGLDPVTSAYISVALTFSSTIITVSTYIILKLLSGVVMLILGLVMLLHPEWLT